MHEPRTRRLWAITSETKASFINSWIFSRLSGLIFGFGVMLVIIFGLSTITLRTEYDLISTLSDSISTCKMDFEKPAGALYFLDLSSEGTFPVHNLAVNAVRPTSLELMT